MPIFALSGGAHVTAPEDCLKFAKGLGASEVFAKPVNPATIIDKLEQYLQHAVARPDS